MSQAGAGTSQLHLAAFGLDLLSEVRPPGTWGEASLPSPSLRIRTVDAAAVEDVWSGLEEVAWEAVIDGAPFVVERGVTGDHRFVHGATPDRSGVASGGTRALHHLSADTRVLRCAPSDPTDPSWWRLVLDSVLFTVSLLRGYEALHAGAIATPSGVIAITAASGGGKSTLLAALLARGSALMADDVLVLEPRGSLPPVGHPAPPLMTVPAARMSALNGHAPPATICSIGDERWIAVPVHTEPLPLKALVVLERRTQSSPAESEPSLTRIEKPLAPLLESLMSFPDTAARQRARFELASVLASECAVWRLTAGLDTAPEVLADVVLGTEL